MTNAETIISIIDAHLKIVVENEFNKYPGEIAAEMTDPAYASQDGWGTWFPIDSTVTARDIESFEVQLGHKLPEDYKTFLRHKHFYELHISEASFCSHPVHTWLEHQHKMIFHGWPTEELIERGYIPFADWSDWGLLCFNVNSHFEENDYSIVLWDHDDRDEVKKVAYNFKDLLIRLDKGAELKLLRERK